MFINTKHRSDEPEIMDDFAMEGEILRDALDKIAKINQLLGGNQLTLQAVQDLIVNIPKQSEIVIVDIGCGNGDMLRTLANYGLKHNLNFRLIGIDANNFTIKHA
ncbi:methyltransferase, partial [Flavobacterium sp.]|uniref:methyltransferase n=1 Tax=Flavobacterium sp. TaxID=239 RepID=UPI00379311EA